MLRQNFARRFAQAHGADGEDGKGGVKDHSDGARLPKPHELVPDCNLPRPNAVVCGIRSAGENRKMSLDLSLRSTLTGEMTAEPKTEKAGFTINVLVRIGDELA